MPPHRPDAVPLPAPLLEAERLRLCLGLLLTTIAGYVDAVGYLHLEGLYLSFMSGNSMESGVGAAGQDWAAAGPLLLLVASFVGGVLLGTLAGGLAGAWAVPVVLALEAGLLAMAVGLMGAGWRMPLAVAPVVAAMGTQNVVLQPLGGVRLGATFITGTLVSVGQELGRALLRKPGAWVWRRHAMVWAALVCGAVTGAIWHAPARLDAFLAPAALLAALAAVCAAMVATDRWRHRRAIAGRPAGQGVASPVAAGSRA